MENQELHNLETTRNLRSSDCLAFDWTIQGLIQAAVEYNIGKIMKGHCSISYWSLFFFPK